MSACHDTAAPASHPHHAFTLALVGNPNAGKTTLFNALTGLRAKTANFPGTTVERKVGRLHLDHKQIIVVDLPGLYSLDSKSPDEKLAADALQGKLEHTAPSAALVVVDATNLERNLFLVSQVLELKKCPVIVALNMMDMARRDGIRIDVAKLRKELGCAVIPVAARNGEGIAELKAELDRLVTGSMPEALQHADPGCAGCTGCTFQARYEWTEQVSTRVMDAAAPQRSEWTDRLDDVLTHPVFGVTAFLAVMLLVFALIFWAAKIPMNLIDQLFSHLGGWVGSIVPAGDFQSLLVNGVIGGVGGILVFLPQICILFFALSILEDTGYLARAAFVMDKIMRRFGLPGKAFVPMLSAHACAIPAIMSTRVIENPRDRLVTILITPLMACSARIPVYAMVTAMIFPNSPLKAGLVFTAAYAFGVATALVMALIFRGTILPGGSKPLMIELPQYRIPGLRVALLHTFDRAKIFVKQAGTIILAISLILWALSYYPKSAPPAAAVAMTEQAAQVEKAGDAAKAGELRIEAGRLTAQHSLQNSFAGKIGHVIEPAIAPLGYDWQIGIGIFSSFAAREVIVSTLAIVYGVGEDAAENNRSSLYDSLRRAKRTDGTPIFNVATCASLLVFYILAAQCLSTTAVVRRETGGWKWPLFQIAYMTGLAYFAALIVYQTLRHFGHA
ncbi:MAG TPA: ferrous iron transport protein B [Candidatus Acidoferrales bacterium]|jgi:ferrous iron transport protein B|nr:ferrous iron transport protein B [Candidatus Acidoferrales bacterium]